MSKKSEVTRKELAERHKDAIARNYERRNMLRAIIDMWEARPDADQDYLREARRRYRATENNLKAMKP